MECISEQERFENRVLPHDVPVTPEQLAIQALIDRITKTSEAGDE